MVDPNDAPSLADLRGLDRMRTPMWVFDPSAGRILWANRAGLALWDASTLEDLNHRVQPGDMSPAKRTRMLSLIREIRAGGTPETTWIIYPNGEPRPLHVRCLPVHLADGPAPGPAMGVLVEVVGICQTVDPTLLRAAEALDHAPGMIEICRSDGTPLFRNAAAIAVLGPVTTAAERIADRMLRSRDAAELLESLGGRRPLTLLAPVGTADGERWYRLEVRPMPDPATGAPVMLVTGQDETVQRRMARELEDGRTFLRAVVDVSPDALFVHTADGRYALSNHANSDLFGLPTDAMEGRDVGPILGSAGASDGWMSENADLLASGGEVSRTQDLTLPDGRRRTFRVTKRPLHLRNGSYVVGAAVDVTELVEARQRAEASERAKSAFLAAMSHELRTPLNSILGFSEILSGAAERAVPLDKVADYAATIHEAGTLLLGQVNDLLDLAKMEAGKTEIDPELVRIGPIVDGVLRLMQPRAAAGGLDIQAGPIPPDLSIWADPRALRQILLNLVSNAVKFTGAGGRVDITAVRLPGGGVDLCVADTGRGIPEHQLARLFEPFEQLDNVYRRGDHGTGLGLAIVKRLTERHGGAVLVQSVPGRGTRMTVRLPCRQAN